MRSQGPAAFVALATTQGADFSTRCTVPTEHPMSPAMVVLIRHLRRVKLLAREVKKRYFSVAGVVTQLDAFGYSAPKYA